MGDSGSWVLDSLTGDLYGMVIAGSSVTNEAYVVPACAIIEDIAHVTGEEDIQLATLDTYKVKLYDALLLLSL